MCTFAYSGHRLRLTPADEVALRTALAQVVAGCQPAVAHGSLACGADVLWAEALLEQGVALHVVLPFEQQQFVEASVRGGGDDWVVRHEAVLRHAASVTEVAPGLRGEQTYALAAEVLGGRARLDAAERGVQAHLGAVWDGEPAGGAAGTGADVARWQQLGGELSVVSPRGQRVRGEGAVSPGPAPVVQVSLTQVGPADETAGETAVARTLVGSVPEAVRVARATLDAARAAGTVDQLVLVADLDLDGGRRRPQRVLLDGAVPGRLGATEALAAVAAMVPGCELGHRVGTGSWGGAEPAARFVLPGADPPA